MRIKPISIVAQLLFILPFISDTSFSEEKRIPTLDPEFVPHMRGVDAAPNAIFYKKNRFSVESENYKHDIQVYVAIWNDGRIVWSLSGCCEEETWTYYETYLSHEQLSKFWKNYKAIKPWKFFHEGPGSPLISYEIAVTSFDSTGLSESDCFMKVPDPNWPEVKDYPMLGGINPNFVEAWVRLRHRMLSLIPNHPSEILSREKIDTEFYLPVNEKMRLKYLNEKILEEMEERMTFEDETI